MTAELVLTDLADGVLTISLNRPEKRNALSPELFAAVGEAFAKAEDRAVRAVLLRGEGPAFCAGIDVQSLAALGVDGAGRDFHAGLIQLQDIFMALERIGKPSVCAVHGVAVGAGLQLAMACDLRVASDDARLGLFEIHYGIIPDLGGIHRAVQLCGLSRAKDLVLTGREVPPREALTWGLVDRVVPAPQVLATAQALVAEIAAKAPLAARWGKRIADRAASGQSSADNLRDVGEAQLECLQSPNFMEAVSARLQKRAPVFSQES